MFRIILPTKIPSDVFSQHSFQNQIYQKKSSNAENKLDSDGKRLVALDLVQSSSTSVDDPKPLEKDQVFWPGNEVVTRLRVSRKGWEEIEEIQWELKGEVNTVKQRDDPMSQSSGGKQRRTIFKSIKILKKSSNSEPGLDSVKASRNGLSFPISSSLQEADTLEDEMIFLISSFLPESLPKQSAAARGRTLSQRPSLPPTFRNTDRFSVVYCVKVWFRLKSSKRRMKHRIWKPFIVLPFSVFPTPNLDLPPLTSTPSQPPPNWKVARKTGAFSNKRTITSNFAFPSPRYISSKDWVPFFLYVEIKSTNKASLATSRLPVLPSKGIRMSTSDQDQGKNRNFLLEPQIILSRQDDSPATALGKSFAAEKRIPCEIEWISGSSPNEGEERPERGRNGNENRSALNSRRNSQDDGIGYSWTDIVKTSSEAVTLNNMTPNNGTENPSTFEGGEELLPRFSQLSFRSASRSRSRSRQRVSTSDSLPFGNRSRETKNNVHETWYRSALLFGKIRTRALTPGFGLPSLSIQYNWRLAWNVDPTEQGGKVGKVLKEVFNRDKEILSMDLGFWLPSSGIIQDELVGLSREEVEKRVGISR